MRPDDAHDAPPSRAGAAAGAIAVALFAASAVAIGERPPFDAPAAEVAAHLAEQRTRTQVGCALFAATAPLLAWFLATVAAAARSHGPRASATGTLALGCGLVFVALMLADITALAVAALRPERLAAQPELATLLRDYELLAMGAAAPVASAMLLALGALALRHGALWPRPLGWLALAAAAAYALRFGTLFTSDGPLAADGTLGLDVPVAALAGWTLVASLALVRSLPGGAAARQRL